LSFYAAQFGSYNETYGALGAIAVLLLWFQLSAYSLLLGATLNAEIEFEVRSDTADLLHDLVAHTPFLAGALIVSELVS